VDPQIVAVRIEGEAMKRILLIDRDASVMQRVGLQCLEREVGVVMAENLCEGVRALLQESVSLIVADAALLRLTPREHATLFERVAPQVPVAVVFRPDAALEARVAYEVLGFKTLTRPLAVEDLLEKAAVDVG
jgi:DNA-binding NtrC family response regulator